MKRWQERAVVAGVIALVAGWLMLRSGEGGSIFEGLEPPALLEAGPRVDTIDLKNFPAGTEAVELALASGEKLRGVFVPSDPGAPVVLHLLESSGSVGSPQIFHGGNAMLRELAELGFASLALDYRGIGASEGERSVAHLEEDARAMWSEAVRRAGGRDDLVIVRAISIGTIAASLELERGANPGAVVFIDPVRAETAVEHAADDRYGFVAGWIASAKFRPIAKVDVVAAIGRIRAPLLAISPEHDKLLSRKERQLLRGAVELAKGRWVASSNTHEGLAAESHEHVGDAEREFLRATFPNWPASLDRAAKLSEALDDEAHERLRCDEEANARFESFALDAGPIPANALAAMALLKWPTERVRDFAAEFYAFESPWPHLESRSEWSALLDRSDPAGELPFAYLRLNLMHLERAPGTYPPDPPIDTIYEVVQFLRTSQSPPSQSRLFIRADEPCQGRGGSSFRLVSTCPLDAQLHDRSPEDSRRQLARMLLKGAGIPDRVVVDESGVHLEAKECGEWKRVDLDWQFSDDANAAVDAPSRLGEGKR